MESHEEHFILQDIDLSTQLIPQMMNPKVLFHWFYGKIRNYNLFMQEEDDYDDDDDDDESKDPAIVLKHQKYTTWLYVLLLMSK